MAQRHYMIQDKIRGSKVHKARMLEHDQRPGNQLYAVKVLDCRSLNDIDEKVKNEVNILQKMASFNRIVSLMDVLETNLHYYLVMEYLGGGDVFDRIKTKEMYPQEEARLLIKNLLSAVDFIHYSRVAHRDLKPQNLLFQDVNNDFDFKVAGFSYAKKVLRPKSLITKCGTPNYVSPEILRGQPYDESVDIWSVGVIIYTVLVGYPPFLEEAQAQDRQIQRIIAGDYQFYEEDWGHIAPLAKDLIKQLLVVDPDRRLKVSAAREHPWVIAAGQINIGGGGTNSLIPPVRTHPSSLPEPNQEIRFNTAI